MSSTRIGFIADTHCKYDDPHVFMDILLEMESAKLDLIVHLGDAIDAEGISTHEKDEAGINVLDEINEWFEWLEIIRNICPHVVCLMGNHENRLFREARRKPRVPLYPYEEELAQRCDRVIPHNGCYNFGRNWTAVHGRYCSKVAGRPVSTEIEHRWKNVIMGHVHRYATIMHTKGVHPDAQVVTGVECPCSAMPSMWYDGIDHMSWADWQLGWVLMESYRDTYRPIPHIHTESVGPDPSVIR